MVRRQIYIKTARNWCYQPLIFSDGKRRRYRWWRLPGYFHEKKRSISNKPHWWSNVEDKSKCVDVDAKSVFHLCMYAYPDIEDTLE